MLVESFAVLYLSHQVNEASATVGSPGEALSKRCVLLLKTALKPDFWQGKTVSYVKVITRLKLSRLVKV